jgi:carbon monoxide dehydrogenase subunit G
VKTEASIIIDRPLEEVWEFMMDLSKIPTWDTAVSEVKQTSTGPIGVGTTLEITEKTMKRTISARVIEYEPNRRLSFEHTSGPFKGSKLTNSVETVDGKTRLNWDEVIKLNGFYKLLRVFITSSRERRTVVAILENAKRILESQVQS